MNISTTSRGNIKELMPLSQDRLSPPERWFDEHSYPLLRYAYSRVRNNHVAEELVQETFIAALKGRESFSGRSSERTWFIGILRHKIVDYFRRSSKEKAVADVDVAGFDECEASNEGEWSSFGETSFGNPERRAESSDFWNVLKSCLAKLPDNLSEAFILREVKGLESEEICQRLGITQNNLWVRLHRARNQLRSGLTKRWFGNMQTRVRTG